VNNIILTAVGASLAIFLVLMAIYHKPNTAEAAGQPPPYVKEYQIGSDKITVFAVPHPTVKRKKINCVLRTILQCDL